VGGSIAVMGAGGRPEFWIHDLSDGRLTLVEWARTPAPVRSDDVERMRAFGVPGNREWNDRLLGSVPFPDRFPVFMAIVVDQDSRIWIQRYRPPWERSEPGGEWLVFDGEGRFRYTVRFEADFTVLTAKGDLVVGRVIDALGVNTVVGADLSTVRRSVP